MGNAHPFVSVRSSFDPDTLQIMGVAFDTAWYKLLVSGSALTASWRAEHVWVIGAYSLVFGIPLVGLSLRLRKRRHA